MAENTIKINGREMEFESGETILEVARRNGIFIPTFCHLDGATPTGACRICVVEIKGGRALAPACATPASKGQEIFTNSPAVIQARRYILSMLLQTGHHNCSISNKVDEEWTGFQQRVGDYDQSDELCEVYGNCKLQAYAYRYQVDPTRLESQDAHYPIEMASPLIVRDFSRCILCGRCVQACNVIQVNNAISNGFRGAKAKIVAMGDDSLERSDCVFCGQCIQACPVGALVEKRNRYQVRPWETTVVRTTCHYCGVGCQMDLHVKDGRVQKVTAAQNAEPNQSRLCVKGRFAFDFLNSPARLTKPLVRDNGQLREATWEEALDRVAAKVREIKASDGPDAIAAIVSAKSTNESLYSAQRLMRSAIGTNNIASPFAAMGMTNSLAEIERASAILLIGSNITEENPVAATFVKRAAIGGRCKLIVVDERDTKIARFAHLHLKARAGTESVLINGITFQILQRDRINLPQDADLTEVRRACVGFPLNRVVDVTGLDADLIDEAIETLEDADSTMVIHGSSVAAWGPVFQNLQTVLGNMGRECGGVNYIGELNNSQGAADMGLDPAFLPGHARVDDAEARATFEKAWGAPLGETPGLNFDEIVGAAAGSSDRKIGMLLCAGENLAIVDPVMPAATQALDKVDFLVALDCLENDTTRQADIVLPTAAWAEEDGTTTNCERRVGRVRRAVDPPADAWPETRIYAELAKRLGQDWGNKTPRQIWDTEITPLAPVLAGITYDAIESGGLQWPLGHNGNGAKPLADIPVAIRTRWSALNYHHRTLCEHCEGLLEILPQSTGVGTFVPPSDAGQVRPSFLAILRADAKQLTPDESDSEIDAQVDETRAKIDAVLDAYQGRRGGLIPVLQKVQEILGYLPVQAQNYIALGLGLSPADVFGVVSFYSFFTMEPRGKHVIRVCLGTACYVKGAGKIIERLKKHLGVDVGLTTQDREFTLEGVRCVGACGLAPVLVVDTDTHGQVEAAQAVKLVEGYRGKQ